MKTSRVSKLSPRGRPITPLDEKRIAALHAEGLGVRAIASVLSEERQEPVSPMTVWRRVRALGLAKEVNNETILQGATTEGG